MKLFLGILLLTVVGHANAETGCPLGFTVLAKEQCSGKGICCGRSICAEGCAKELCEGQPGGKWIPKDYNSNPYTCEIASPTCGTLEPKTDCYTQNAEAVELGGQTVEACQKWCEGKAASGEEGCCEYQVDYNKCVWYKNLQSTNIGDYYRYGTLCKRGD